MKSLVSVFFFLLFIGACKERSKETVPAIPIYSIDIDTGKEASLWDFFSKIDIIPLKTPDSIVCCSGRVFLHKDNLFLWDNRQYIIFCFDTLGNYRYMINKLGRGPENYMDILSFFVDRFNDRIVIHDHYFSLQFDLKGRFIQKIKNPEGVIIHAAEMLNKDTMACFMLNGHENQTDIINYLSLKEKKYVTSCYKEDPIFPINRFISPYNGKSFYAIHKDATIYSLDKGKLTPEYKWDFGKYDYDYKDLDVPKLESWKEMQKIQRGWIYRNCPWFINEIGENNTYRYACISLFKNAKLTERVPDFQIFWHKATRTYKVISKFKEGEFRWNASAITEHAMYRAANLNYISEDINPESLTPENRKILESLPEDANPVLIKYTFK